MADFQREKLIELLGLYLPINVPSEVGGYATVGERTVSRADRERLADHLLANGVIVPPCKVGDTVYMPWEWNGTKGVAILTVTHIITNDSHSYIKAPLYSDDEDYSCKYGYGRFEFDDFGKSVFLTLEEAEKAQKGGAEKCR